MLTDISSRTVDCIGNCTLTTVPDEFSSLVQDTVTTVNLSNGNDIQYRFSNETADNAVKQAPAGVTNGSIILFANSFVISFSRGGGRSIDFPIKYLK